MHLRSHCHSPGRAASGAGSKARHRRAASLHRRRPGLPRLSRALAHRAAAAPSRHARDSRRRGDGVVRAAVCPVHRVGTYPRSSGWCVATPSGTGVRTVQRQASGLDRASPRNHPATDHRWAPDQSAQAPRVVSAPSPRQAWQACVTMYNVQRIDRHPSGLANLDSPPPPRGARQGPKEVPGRSLARHKTLPHLRACLPSLGPRALGA